VSPSREFGLSGNAFGDLGQYQRAIEDCDRAIQLQPDVLDVGAQRGLSKSQGLWLLKRPMRHANAPELSVLVLATPIRMSAIRMPAVAAIDNGRPTPELAAGIAGVKSAKSIGVRSGRWLPPGRRRHSRMAPDTGAYKNSHDALNLTQPGRRRGFKPARQRAHLRSGPRVQAVRDFRRKCYSNCREP